jgi:hypothetical protein
MGSNGLTSSNGSILGTGTCSNILLKLTVCWLSDDGFRVNLANASFLFKKNLKNLYLN